MTNPKRSSALARALAQEADGLPAEFAASVAARAERGGWGDLSLPCAFLAMLTLCVIGWWRFGAPGPLLVEWSWSMLDAASSRPWLLIGLAGVAGVQLLAFRRRHDALEKLMFD